MRFEQAKELLAALEREGVRYVLVGSMAMAVQGLVRATVDIDFFVAPTADNVGRLKRALRVVYLDAQIDEIDSGDFAGDYPVIRYSPPDENLIIDFIARLGEAFEFDDVKWEDKVIEGVRLRTATREALLAMKRSSDRLQDLADVETLLLEPRARIAGVQKFRRIEDVPPPPPLPPDGRGLRHAFEWSHVAVSLAGWEAPVGVQKFSSISVAELNKQDRRGA